MADAGAEKQTNTMASAGNVRDQTKLMNSAGSAWHAVKVGNLEKITNLFPALGDVYAQGPVGENVFHIAMLLNTPTSLAIARYLIRVYGRQLVNTPYQERKKASDPPGLYEGETALHIAIVNHDLDFVKLLINSGAYVRARAYGGFFDIKGPCYYGEYPLSFAACTGQANIVQYLTRHGARPDLDADLRGNTSLHMCVYHTQPDMYNLLLELGALEQLENNDGMSCMLLAARLGNATMFQYICDRNRQIAWQYGPVTSFILAMREIDTVQSIKSNPKLRQSSLTTILYKGHRHMLQIPLVDTLFNIKWSHFGFRLLMCDIGLHTLSLALVCAVTFVRSQPHKRGGADSVVHAVLQYVLLFVVLLHWSNAFNDFWHSVRHTLNIQRIRHATISYVPPTYPIPNSAPSQAEEDAPADAVGEGAERLSSDVRTFMMMQNLGDADLEDLEAELGGGPAPEAPARRPTWRQQGAYQELSNAALSEAHTRKLLQPSWAVSAAARRPRGRGAALEAASTAPGGDVSVLIEEDQGDSSSERAIAEAKEGGGLRDYADEVWNSVIQTEPHIAKRIPNYNPDDYEQLPDSSWARQSTYMAHIPEEEKQDRPVGATNLFEELINEAFDANQDSNPNDLGDARSAKGNAPAHVSHAKTVKGVRVKNVLPSPMSPKAMTVAVFRFIVASLYYWDDIPYMIVLVYYCFALVQCLCWIGFAGWSDADQSRDEVKAVDALLAASLFTGFVGAPLYFARGWRTPGAVVVVMMMALKRIAKTCLIFASTVIGASLAIACLVMGPADIATMTAAYPGATYFGVVWSCWKMVRSERAQSSSDAALYAVLDNTDSPLGRWESALVWVLYLYLQWLTPFLFAIIAAICINIMLQQFARAVECWKMQWCSYILLLEYRLPEASRQKYRIGDKGMSSQWRRLVYIYQYEEIDHQASSPEAQIEEQRKLAAAAALASAL